MTQEVLKLALEALEGLIKKTSGQAIYSFMETERRIAMSACVGIKEALREHAMREVQRLGQEIEQEPIGTVKELFTQTAWERLDLRGSTKVYLNTTPPQRGKEPVKYSDYKPDGVHHNKPQQEPVAYWKEHAQGLQRDYDSLLAEFQAQRKPLTDEEIMEKFNKAKGAVWISDFARDIEAAHGIRE